MTFERSIQQTSYGLSRLAATINNDALANRYARLADKIIMFEEKKDLLKLTEDDKETLSSYHQDKDKVIEKQDYMIRFERSSEDEPFMITLFIYKERQDMDNEFIERIDIQGVSAYSLAMRTLKYLNKNYPGSYTYPQDDFVNFEFGRRKRDQAKMICRMEYFSEQTF